MTNEPLTPQDHDDLTRLPRDIPPPGDLEARTVRSLQAAGALSHRPRIRPAWTWTLQIAAALTLVVGSFLAGRLSTVAPGASPDAAANRYLLLLYGGDAASNDEERARVEEYATWAETLRQAGQLVGADRLAARVDVVGSSAESSTIANSPSGFFMVRAASREDALAIASGCPHLRHGGTVVVRAIDTPTGMTSPLD
jgi:hypothetical protein